MSDPAASAAAPAEQPIVGAGKGAKKPQNAKMIPLAPPVGTRDFFPDEYRYQQYMFRKFDTAARAFAFKAYDAPVLENEDLYKRKAGEEITQQMYNFVDKEGAAVTLRPEMTPSLARMVLRLMQDGADVRTLLPLKWFSIPQCWRFETTQRGRKREHYQWNCDIIGEPSIAAEVDLICLMVHFFESVGVTAADVGIKVNSRKVLQTVLTAAGVSEEQFPAVCVVVDKLDKIGAENVAKELEAMGVHSDVSSKILKATEARSIDEFAAVTDLVGSEDIAEFRRLFEMLTAAGVADWVMFDAAVVRGLAYYTGVVFEAFDRKGELRAICGGGRYDKLLSLYGAKKNVPMVGFGFGDCVLFELLKERDLLPADTSDVDFVVAAFNDEMVGPALLTARKLRNAGARVDVLAQPAKKVGKAFNYADRVGAERIVFVAPGEWQQRAVRIKNLREEDENKKQVDVKFADLSRWREVLNA